MRTTLIIAVLVAMPVWVSAQGTVPDTTVGLRSARGSFVAVIDSDSREWQGKLLAVEKSSLIVELDALPRRFELANVKRVDAHGDRVWDGALKGALIGGVLAGVTLGGRAAFGSAIVYGLIGVGVDALNRCNHTVYRAPAVSASVKVLSW